MNNLDLWKNHFKINNDGLEVRKIFLVSLIGLIRKPETKLRKPDPWIKLGRVGDTEGTQKWISTTYPLILTITSTFHFIFTHTFTHSKIKKFSSFFFLLGTNHTRAKKLIFVIKFARFWG